MFYKSIHGLAGYPIPAYIHPVATAFGVGHKNHLIHS